MKTRIAFLTLVLALASLPGFAADVVVLINGNFEEYKAAAKSAVEALRSSAGKTPSVLELYGGSEDKAVLDTLKAQKPKVVVATGVYAVKSARKAVPEAWIVYALVLYPEVEEFTEDPKMIGISSMGSEKELFALANSLAPVKVLKLAVLHSVILDPSVGPLLARLSAAGFQVTDYPLSEAPLMEDVMRDVTQRFQAVLLLPDPITENPSRLRYMITSCMEKGVLTLTPHLTLLYHGALCGTYVKSARAGREAGVVAGQILATGKPPAQNLLPAPDSETAVNLTVAKLLKLAVRTETDLQIE